MSLAIKRFAYILIGTSAGLSGCHKPPPKPPVATPAPVIVAKPSQPLPPRTPGLWETKLTEDGSEDLPQTLQICIDAMTDQHLGILGTDLSGDNCAKKTYSPMGEDSWGLLAECHMGTGVIDEYSGSITGDYRTSYTMKLRSQTTGGNLPQMNRVTNYAVESRRLGPCLGDQKPGDVMDMVNVGVKFNLFDMAGVRPKNSKPTVPASGPGGD